MSRSHTRGRISRPVERPAPEPERERSIADLCAPLSARVEPKVTALTLGPGRTASPAQMTAWARRVRGPRRPTP